MKVNNMNGDQELKQFGTIDIKDARHVFKGNPP